MKKDEKLQAEAKAQFFEYGRKLGTREIFLDYVWNVVFGASMGYSFSQLHSYSYSIIALQELNLNYFYPKVYWNCACLSIEAMGLKDNEDGSDKSSATDYGEIAKAIYKMKQSSIEVHPPSIDDSEDDFTPRESDNTILFGLTGISGINRDIAKQIISNRPYISFKDFYTKNSYQGSLITASKFITLIKAGCFDEFEPDRIKVMKEYVSLSFAKKDKVTLANLSEAKRIGAQIPKQFMSPYNFKKYVCSKNFFYGSHPKFKSKKLYWLDEKAAVFFKKYCQSQLVENKDYFYDNDLIIVVDKSLDKLFEETFNQLKEYISTQEFIDYYNQLLLQYRYKEICPIEDINHWSFEATSYYHYGQHELANVNIYKYNIDHLRDIPEEPIFIERTVRGRTWKQYYLYQIAGTVIDRNDNNHLITLLTLDNEVINVKFNGDTYAYYKQQISEENENGTKNVIDPSWLKRGSLLLIVGYRRSETDFVVKNYKSSIYPHKVQKIISIDNDTGNIELQGYRYGYDIE